MTTSPSAAGRDQLSARARRARDRRPSGTISVTPGVALLIFVMATMGILAYDPLRMVALRARIVDAIHGLDTLSSWDPEATAATATIASTSRMLRDEHLRAVDETIRSDAMERLDFGVELVGAATLRRLVRATGRRGAGGRGGWRMPTASPDDRVGEMSDEDLLAWMEETLGREASDGGPPAAFDDVRLAELCAAFTELRRRSVADPDGFGRRLVAAMGSEGGRRGVLRLGAELSVSMSEIGVDEDHPLRNLIASIIWTALLNTVADGDEPFDRWMLEHTDHAAIARAVLMRPGTMADPELVVGVATTMTTKGSAAWSWYGEAPADFRDVYGVLLDAIRADPDMAAALLADEETRAVFLSEDWSGDDPLFEGVTTTALLLPMLQRRGSAKSLDQANSELADGWAIWSTAVERNDEGLLSTAAKRALAAALPLYLPSIGDQLLDENKNKESDDGQGTRDDRLVEADIADERIPISTYGGFSRLFGTMTLDPVAARRLAHTSYDFLVRRMADGVATADDLAELRADLRPATELNELIADGIDLKEAEMRAEQTEVGGALIPLARTVLPAAERYVLRRTLWWQLATVPARNLLDVEPEQVQVTLSRTIPLDHGTMRRIALLEVMAAADVATRQRFGLGEVTAQRWRELDDALARFWTAESQEAIDEAEDRIESLTDDHTSGGEHDPAGAALARAVGELG